MTIKTSIPLSKEEYYRYSMVIEGQLRYLTFYWNTRTSNWYLDLRNEQNIPIVLGTPLVPDYPIFLDYSLEDFGITGYFALTSNNNAASHPSEDSTIMAQFYELNYYHLTQEERENVSA